MSSQIKVMTGCSVPGAVIGKNKNDKRNCIQSSHYMITRLLSDIQVFFKSKTRHLTAGSLLFVQDEVFKCLGSNGLLLGHYDGRWLPATVSRWKDRWGLGLRPIETHGQVDCVVWRREPVRLFVGAGAFVLNVNRQRAVRVLLHVRHHWFSMRSWDLPSYIVTDQKALTGGVSPAAKVRV